MRDRAAELIITLNLVGHAEGAVEVITAGQGEVIAVLLHTPVVGASIDKMFRALPADFRNRVCLCKGWQVWGVAAPDGWPAPKKKPTGRRFHLNPAR